MKVLPPVIFFCFGNYLVSQRSCFLDVDIPNSSLDANIRASDGTHPPAFWFLEEKKKKASEGTPTNKVVAEKRLL